MGFGEMFDPETEGLTRIFKDDTDQERATAGSSQRLLLGGPNGFVQDDCRELERFEGHGNGVLRNAGLLFGRLADSLSCMTTLQIRATGVLGLVCVLVAASPIVAQNALPGAMASGIDTAAADVLKATGAPSASVAVVQDGKVAYVKAYGIARLDPAVAAEPVVRYSIGS